MFQSEKQPQDGIRSNDWLASAANAVQGKECSSSRTGPKPGPVHQRDREREGRQRERESKALPLMIVLERLPGNSTRETEIETEGLKQRSRRCRKCF